MGNKETEFKIEDFIPSQEDFGKGYDSDESQEAWDEFESNLDQKLVIAFLGTVSSGKTTAIKTLFNVDFGTIGPIPGSTTKVKVEMITENVFIVDAPGFGDIRTEVSQRAKDICDEVDIFVYILNAEGGFKEQEKKDFDQLLKYNRNVLVVFNKIDLIREHQREELIEHTRKLMGVEPENFIPAAFDPLLSSIEPINVDLVEKWIFNLLRAEGKDILFAKVTRKKDKACNRYIQIACTAAAGVAAIPVPGSDYGPLTAIQVVMIAKIALIYGHKPSRNNIITLIAQTMAGRAGREAFRAVFTALKAAGWLGGPIIAAAIAAIAAAFAISITYGLGKAAQAYYKSDLSISFEEVGDIFNRSYAEYKATKGAQPE